MFILNTDAPLQGQPSKDSVLPQRCSSLEYSLDKNNLKQPAWLASKKTKQVTHAPTSLEGINLQRGHQTCRENPEKCIIYFVSKSSISHPKLSYGNGSLCLFSNSSISSSPASLDLTRVEVKLVINCYILATAMGLTWISTRFVWSDLRKTVPFTKFWSSLPRIMRIKGFIKEFTKGKTTPVT